MRSESDSTDAGGLAEEDKWIKHEHPNRLLRFYGNVMSEIGTFFLRLGMPYMTTYEMQFEDLIEDLEDDTI